MQNEKGEKDLQGWCEKHAKRGTLATLIEGCEQVDGWRNEWAPLDVALDLSDPPTARAVNNIQRICHAMIEARLESANKDLRLIDGEEYKPDLVLHNDEDNIYIIVELKVGKAAERQAITELLAYSEVIRQSFNNPEIYLVVASTMWNSLLSTAVSGEMRAGRYPLLPLTVKLAHGDVADGATAEASGSYTFGIRWDLCRERAQPAAVTTEAFVCDTVAFTFEQCGPGDFGFSHALDRLVVGKALELTKLAEQMERPRRGFVLVWQTEYQTWNVTTCILNEARLPAALSPKSPIYRSRYPDSDGTPYAAVGPSNIASGFQLVNALRIADPYPATEFSGFDNWPLMQLALRHWRARLVFAAGWGQTRAMFDGSKPVAGTGDGANLALHQFPGDHPFRWIPMIDAFTGAAFDARDPSTPSTLCALGAVLGEVTDYYACDAEGLVDSREFGYLVAIARLIWAWDQVCNAWRDDGADDRPHALRFESSTATRLSIYQIDLKRQWCVRRLCRPSPWHLFAFHLGFARGYAERRQAAPVVRHVTPASMVDEANQLLTWARGAPEVAADSDAADALAYLERGLSDSPWLDLSALRWRDNGASLAVLADLASACGQLLHKRA